jgi:hypothetical protein
MAIVFLTIVSTGQCQNWCSQYSCDERNKYGGSECGGCGVCKPPPAPPLPPFGPQHCANTFEVCAQGFIGSCCIKPSDGCFKRTGRRFSQCRPFPTADRCVSDDTWTCPDDWIEPSPLPPSPPQSPSPPRQPPSPPCTPSWQFCDRTQCCAEGNFACYKRKPSQGPSFVFGVNGTQCRFKAAGMGGMRYIPDPFLKRQIRCLKKGALPYGFASRPHPNGPVSSREPPRAQISIK